MICNGINECLDCKLIYVKGYDNNHNFICMGALMDQCKNPPESQDNNELKGTSAGNEDDKVKLENIDKGIKELLVKLRRAESNLEEV